MKNSLLLPLLLLLAVLSRAQVTQIASNNSLFPEMVLGNKAILVEEGMKRIWVTDATTGGTFRLYDTLTLGASGALLNGKYIFGGISPTYGAELWISDGTVAGTRVVKDIYPGTTGSEPDDNFVLLNGYLYFTASTPGEGRELWRTNGTPEGTTLVKDITPGPAQSGLRGGYNMYSSGTYVLFRALSPNEGYELWRSDGTEGGTFRVKDINPGPAGSDPDNYLVYNSMVLFWAETAANGRELWRTDGTEGGTQLVKDVRTGTASSVSYIFPLTMPAILYPFNNRVLFIADDGVHGPEIWTTNGTTNGTTLLKDIRSGSEGTFATNPYQLLLSVPMNGKLYFNAYQNETGDELWVTDGTTNGTQLFKEILPGMDGGNIYLMPNLQYSSASSAPVHVGAVFYFLFVRPAGGVELWKSDGTVAGTVNVKTVKTTNNEIEGYPSFLYTNAGLYFTADDGVHGSELWKSDGTEAGTALVIDLNQQVDEDGLPESSDISLFPVPVNNKYIFTATNGDDAFMWDLYRLDGNLVPLPLKLESFTVSLAGADGLLKWQTSAEENTLEFVVERSDDTKNFTPLGTVAAAGTAAGKRNYSFIDAAIASTGKTVQYYRLLMKDRDGKATYSKVVSLNLKNGADLTLRLLGNPVQSELKVSLSKTTGPLTLAIRDAAGRTVKSVQVKNDNAVQVIPVTDLRPGIYFIQAESNSQSSIVKFLKQ